jgi:glutamate-1-semialdehyde 2,1-aminomutase
MSLSKEWQQRAAKVIPGGVNSPVRSFKHVGVDPIYFDKAQGAMLYDVDGKSYVDFCLSFGPHILGHSDPAVVHALTEQAAKATSFGACHPLEVRLAELILKGYPFLDRVRLVNSGTEAVMTAIRVARGYTGRPKIVKFEGCYHGHSDGLLAKSGSGLAHLSESSSKGVPASVVTDTLTARYDRLETLEEMFKAHPGQIAAVVFEAIPANHGLWVPSRDHVSNVCRIARANGAVVIFDEVITGFRVGLSGASGYYDQQPDLVTLGKVIGGGLPLAAIAGKKALMDTLAPVGEVYQAGTLSGNPLATAAGCAVLEKLYANPPYAAFEFSTTVLAEGLKSLFGPAKEFQVRHVGSLFWIHFGEESKAFPPEVTPESAKRYAGFFRQALAQGIYFPPSPYEVSFLSTAHTPELLDGVLERLKECRT